MKNKINKLIFCLILTIISFAVIGFFGVSFFANGRAMAYSGDGGFAYIGSSSVYNYSKGSILNFSANSGGVFYVKNNGVLNIAGGELIGNVASLSGGAVYVENGGVVNISGGSVYGNIATKGNGNNIYNAGVCNITGGEIGNISYSSGEDEGVSRDTFGIYSTGVLNLYGGIIYDKIYSTSKISTKSEATIFGGIALSDSGYIVVENYSGETPVYTININYTRSTGDIIEFNGSNVKPDLSKLKIYGYNTESSAIELVKNSSGNWVARLVVRKYKITFDPNLGQCETQTLLVGFNSEIGELPTATRTGYTFDGWYTENHSGEKVSPSMVVIRDQILYAHWVANDYSVAFLNVDNGLSFYEWNNGGYWKNADTTGSDESVYQSVSTTNRGGPFIYGLSNFMINGFKYRIYFDAKATAPVNLNAYFEAGGTSKYIGISTSYQEYFVDLTYDESAEYKTLTLYTNSWSGQEFYIKNIRVAKVVTFGNPYGELGIPNKSGCKFEGWTNSIFQMDEWLENYASVYNLSTINGVSDIDPANNAITIQATSDIDCYTPTYCSGSADYKIPVTAGQSYVFSWVQSRKTDVSRNVIFLFNAKSDVDFASLYEDELHDESTGRYYITFTPTESQNYMAIRFGVYDEDKQAITYSKIKVEEGVRPTDYAITEDMVVTTAKNHNLYASWARLKYIISLETQGKDNNNLANIDGTFETYEKGDKLGIKNQLGTGDGVYYGVTDEVAFLSGKSLKIVGGEGTGHGSRVYLKFAVQQGHSYIVEAMVRASDTQWHALRYELNGGDYNWNNQTVGASIMGQWQKLSIKTPVLTSDATMYVFLYANNGQTVYVDNLSAYDSSSINGSLLKEVSFGSEYGDLPAPIKDGYKFEGWSSSVGGGIEITSQTIVTSAVEHSLYALWRGVTYKIVYNGNGNTGGTTESSTHRVGEPQSLTRNGFVKNGYTFIGWATSDSGEVVYGNGEKVLDITKTENATITLYAKWTPSKIKLTFNQTGGKGGTSVLYYYYNTNTFYSDESCKNVVTSCALPTRVGYTFLNYYGDGSCGGSAGERYVYGYQSGTTAGLIAGDLCQDIYKDATLYASWQANTYYVRYYDSFADTATYTQVSYTYDNSSKTFPKGGLDGDRKWVFLSWATSSTSLVETSYVYGAKVFNLSAENGAIINLYSTYKRYITIQFDANGGTGAISDNIQTQYYNRPGAVSDKPSATLPSDGFAMTGYHMTGWLINSVNYNLGATINLIENYDSASDYVAYAQWSINYYTVQYRNSEDSIWHGSDDTGPMENYALWIDGVEQPDLGKFSSDTVTYSLPYGTKIKIWVKAKYDKPRSYIKWTGPNQGSARLAGKRVEAEFEFYLFCNVDLHYEWNTEGTVLDGSSVQSYWNCYITASENLTPLVLTLDKNGGSGGTDNLYYYWHCNAYYPDATYTSENKITSYTMPTQAGYTFLHYYGDGSCGGTVGERYLYGNESDSTPSLIAGDLCQDIYKNATLYAKWSGNNFTATFDANEGRVSPSSKLFIDGRTYSNLPTPNRRGYNFDCWYYSFNGSSDFINFGRNFMYTDKISVHLMAYSDNWANVATQRLISCTESGGWNIEGNGEYIQFVGYDSGVGYKTTKSGLKWSSLGGGWHSFDLVFDGSYLYGYIDGEKVATSAKFSSGAIGYNASNAIFVGAEAGGNATNPAGEFFSGKIANIIISNSGTRYDGDAKNTFCTPIQNVNLTALWSPISYTIKYNGNGATGGSTADSVHYYDQMGRLTENGFTKTGYSFSGNWNTLANGTGDTYKNAQAVFNLSATDKSIITLYAMWIQNQYTVIYDPNGATGGSTATSIHSFGVAKNLSANGYSKTGYNFKGWSTKANGDVVYSDGQSVINLTSVNGGTITLYASWAPCTYTVVFNAGSGTVSPGNKTVTYNSTYGALPTPQRGGYIFNGWFSKSSGGSEVLNSTIVTTAGNHTLYAQWSGFIYTVVYDGNGHTAGYTATSTHEYDIEKNLSANGFMRTGYTWSGWNTMSDGSGTSFVENQKIKNLVKEGTGVVTLYAMWTANKYSVTYNPNGGSGNVWVEPATYDSEYTIRESTDSNLNYTKTGYSFVGYNESANGQGKLWSDMVGKTWKYSYARNLTLYALWSANIYYIEYNGNRATNGSMMNSVHIYDTASSLSKNQFVNTGYTFAGWATSADGEVIYENQEGVLNLTTENEGIIKLYAKWAVNTYYIKYDGNGATGGSMANSVHIYNVSKALTTNTYTKTDHTFMGWATKSGGSVVHFNGQQVVNLAENQDEIVTLYAVWKKEVHTHNYNIKVSYTGPYYDKSVGSHYWRATYKCSCGKTKSWEPWGKHDNQGPTSTNLYLNNAKDGYHWHYYGNSCTVCGCPYSFESFEQCIYDASGVCVCGSKSPSKFIANAYDSLSADNVFINRVSIASENGSQKQQLDDNIIIYKRKEYAILMDLRKYKKSYTPKIYKIA